MKIIKISILLFISTCWMSCSKNGGKETFEFPSIENLNFLSDGLNSLVLGEPSRVSANIIAPGTIEMLVVKVNNFGYDDYRWEYEKEITDAIGKKEYDLLELIEFPEQASSSNHNVEVIVIDKQGQYSSTEKNFYIYEP